MFDIRSLVKENEIHKLDALHKEGTLLLNAVDGSRDRFTLMHWACFYGNVECLHWLLWNDASLDVRSAKGWTPLHVAAICGHGSCLEVLAENDVDLNQVDKRGYTAAHLAIAHGHALALQTLLRAGIDMLVVDGSHWTLVHCAAFHGQLGCLQILFKWGKFSEDDTDLEGNTAAHLAAMEGHTPCLRFLFRSSNNLIQLEGARNDHGENPAALAERFHKTAVLKYFQERKDQEKERNGPEMVDTECPSHIAAYSGDLHQLHTSTENGVIVVDERDDSVSTLLPKEPRNENEASSGHQKCAGSTMVEKREAERDTVAGSIKKLQGFVDFERSRHEQLEGELDDFRGRMGMLTAALQLLQETQQMTKMNAGDANSEEFCRDLLCTAKTEPNQRRTDIGRNRVLAKPDFSARQ